MPLTENDLSSQEINKILQTIGSDPNAITPMFKHYEKSLGDFLLRKFPSMNFSDAEEIVLDTFKDIYKYPLRYDAAKAKFCTWLCKAALNKAKDLYKWQHRDMRSVDNECQWDEDLEETISDERVDPERIYENNEADSNLERCINKLSDLSRDILDKVFNQGMTKKDAAERLGISKKTLQRRMNNIIKTLHQCFNKSNIIQSHSQIELYNLQRFRVDLPFFVTGALRDESKAFMNMLLKQHPELEVELKFTQAVCNAVRSLGANRQTDNVLERLLEYIKAEELKKLN